MRRTALWRQYGSHESSVTNSASASKHRCTHSRRMLTCSRSTAPLNLPWSQGFYLCCQDVRDIPLSVYPSLMYSQIRSFVHNFYQFIEGVAQHHRNIDDLLSKVSFSDEHAKVFFLTTASSLLTLSWRLLSATR